LNPSLKTRKAPGSGRIWIGKTGLEATDGVVHGVGFPCNVLLAVDYAGQAAQVCQVDTGCENFPVPAAPVRKKKVH